MAPWRRAGDTATTFLGRPTAGGGGGRGRGGEPFPVAARRALADSQLRRNLGKASTTIRAKRAAVVAELPDWEELREAGRAVKAEAMRHLDRYLERLEAQVEARGGTVHWARDATEANAIVTELIRATGATEAVKVKSLATDEIGLNEALSAAGITAYETDLAELIVQLARDRAAAPDHGHGHRDGARFLGRSRRFPAVAARLVHGGEDEPVRLAVDGGDAR